MELLEYLPTAIGTAAVAPALLALWLVIATDERPGPPLKVWTAFLMGAGSISVLTFARRASGPIVPLTGHLWTDLFNHSLFGVAIPEEAVKVVAILAITLWRRRSDDPMDTVVYGAAVGLGFAAYENLAYLLQFPDIWRSLALLRSILTVPFHGALGIVAGAYVAMARTGTALGAHRHDRALTRWRNRLSILAVPVVLHTAFDFPLLALQQNVAFTDAARHALEAASMLIGFGTIVFAGRLVWRVGAHHDARTEIARAKLRNLRGMWALLLAGGGAGFAGVAFVLSSIRHWLARPDRHLAIDHVSLGFISIALGTALLAIASILYVQSRERLLAATAARKQHTQHP